MTKYEKDLILKAETGLNIEQVNKFFTKTPDEKIKTRPAKGGGEWKYVSGSYVTQVLNSLFGFDWSFEIVTSMTEALATANTGTVVVQGKLTVPVGDKYIVKQQYGRKEVAYRSEWDNTLKKKVPTTQLLDFGNDMKAAGTDALKKCASQLGLFADVYSQEDFFEAEIVENGISPSDIMTAVSELNTSKEILEYMAGLTIEEKRVAASIVDKRIEAINARG